MTAKRAQSRTKSKRSDEPTGLDRWSQTSGKSSKKSSADVHQALYALAGLVVILAIALVVSFSYKHNTVSWVGRKFRHFVDVLC